MTGDGSTHHRWDDLKIPWQDSWEHYLVADLDRVVSGLAAIRVSRAYVLFNGGRFKGRS